MPGEGIFITGGEVFYLNWGICAHHVYLSWGICGTHAISLLAISNHTNFHTSPPF